MASLCVQMSISVMCLVTMATCHVIQASAQCPGVILTASPRELIPDVTRNVILKCRLHPEMVGQFHYIATMRIIKNESAVYAEIARLYKDSSLTWVNQSAEVWMDGHIQDTADDRDTVLKVVWELANRYTAGHYYCDIFCEYPDSGALGWEKSPMVELRVDRAQGVDEEETEQTSVLSQIWQALVDLFD